MSYAIGMVIGPFIGGLITKNYGEQSAAFFAAFFSCLSIILAFSFIPGNTKAMSKEEKPATDDTIQTGESLPLLEGDILRLEAVSYFSIQSYS